jgi:hypothetical protein
VKTTTAGLLAQVRQAGYAVIRVEQSRPNRWVLMLRAPEGGELLLLAQARRVIGAADVQDLGELLRLRRLREGLLLAVGGRFSGEAQRSATELRGLRVQLCSELAPPVAPAVAAVIEPARG